MDERNGLSSYRASSVMRLILENITYIDPLVTIYSGSMTSRISMGQVPLLETGATRIFCRL